MVRSVVGLDVQSSKLACDDVENETLRWIVVGSGTSVSEVVLNFKVNPTSSCRDVSKNLLNVQIAI